MFPTVLPLRAVALQILFLLVAITIEGFVLHQLIKTKPKQSMQYAASINLLCTVVGWLSLFLLLTLQPLLPIDWVTNFRANLLNFILFNQWSATTITSLIVIGFAMFFASYGIKQSGLNGLKWLLQAGKSDKKEEKSPIDRKDSKLLLAADKAPLAPTSNGQEGESAATNGAAPIETLKRANAIRVLRGRSPRREMQPQSRAVLTANAASFGAILLILALIALVQAAV